MEASNKVVLNTMVLYGRMLVTMALTLYSTKVVLQSLGSLDYGIFNLIAGVIVMLSFLNTAMATSSQRYLSYHQGRNDLNMQKVVFKNSLYLHIVIGVVIIVLLEICSLFLFDGFLNIPADRLNSAKIIYHYMTLTVFFTIISVPFNALLIAHENMIWVSIVNVMDAVFKLLIAFYLYQSSGDKLIIYGVLTATIVLVDFLLFAGYCFRYYPECSLKGKLKPDGEYLKEMGGFAGWNLFGALCNMGRNEGLALILNIFFGAIVNAAYGIANQVGAQLLFFSGTMLRAIDPQIMKSEGAGQRVRMLKLSTMASKFSFMLFALFAVPLIIEMPGILAFWLKKVPENTVVFCRLVLTGSLINQITIGLQSAMQAEGDIRLYQSLVGGILLLNLPVAYLLLKWGHFPAYMVLVSYVVIQLIATILRMILARNKLGLDVRNYIKDVFGGQLPAFLSIVILDVLLIQFTDTTYRFVLTFLISALLYALMAFRFGINAQEKQLIYSFFQKALRKAGIAYSFNKK